MDESNKDAHSQKLAEKEKELVESRRRESQCKATLSSLRRTAAKLIRALNEVGWIKWTKHWLRGDLGSNDSCSQNNLKLTELANVLV